MSTDAYVFAYPLAAGGSPDLSQLRGYVMADAQVRLRRMRAESVTFALAIDDLQSTAAGPADVGDWVDGWGLSLDLQQGLATSAPELYGWSQRLFLKLMDADLVYRRGDAGWYLRSGRFNDENDRRIDDLEGWDKAARKAQRRLLKRVDGFELEATALDGTPLTLFTPHPEDTAAAELAAISPSRPEVDAWLGDDALRAQVEKLRTSDWTGKSLDQLPAVDVGMSVQVPGVPAPLPILVSPAVDARYGPTAVLGIPSVDDDDKLLARKLPKAGGLAWKVESKAPKATAAARYLTDDMPLSTASEQGAPVPVVVCEKCGTVPMPSEALPAAPGLPERQDCPSCGGAAKRDDHVLHPRLHRAWLELALAVPPADRDATMLAHPGLAPLLPTAQAVAPDHASLELLDMRTIAKALRDVGALEGLEDGEPLGPTVMYAAIEIDGVSDVAELARTHTTDGARFALLHVAAPAKRFEGGEDAIAKGARMLAGLRAFAEPRVGDVGPGARIDTADGLRRRLAGWCDTATARVLENYLKLDTHRATRNVLELRKRIEDFEARVTSHRGEIAGSDAEAVSVAARTLVALLAPVAPGVAAELLGSAGEDGLSWPASQREPMPA